MIFTVPLQAGTVLANVRYRWIALGVEGSALSTGITQPSATYPVFRISATPPTDAEEMIVYDSTDTTNWNNAGYLEAALAQGGIVVSGGTGISTYLSNLKNVCAAYHDKEAADLTINTMDLFLVAANNARRKAERLHDFKLCRVRATLDIDPVTGGALADATIIEGEATAGIKEVINIYGTSAASGFLTPLDFTSTEMLANDERIELSLSNDFWPENRYPSDADFLARYGRSAIVQRGRSLFLNPNGAIGGQTLSVTIEAYGWLPNYGAIVAPTDPEDFIVEFGTDYLQWAIIIELNYRFKTFVPRQEGNLSEPKEQLQEAWRDLLLWDTYQDVNLATSR